MAISFDAVTIATSPSGPLAPGDTLTLTLTGNATDDASASSLPFTVSIEAGGETYEDTGTAERVGSAEVPTTIKSVTMSGQTFVVAADGRTATATVV